MATTRGSWSVILWMRLPSIVEMLKSALLISGLVTFIAAYHYTRIFNSWVEAFHYPKQGDTGSYLTFDKVTGFYGPTIIRDGQNGRAGINIIFGPDANMPLHQDLLHDIVSGDEALPGGVERPRTRSEAVRLLGR